MKSMSSVELIRLIFAATGELTERTGRPISPDGHLVGGIGEVFAAETLGLRLETSSNEGFDARDVDGRTVEIKTTTRSSIRVTGDVPIADRLIVITLDDSGHPTIVYDGPTEPVWAIAGKRQKNNQRAVSVNRSRLSPEPQELPGPLALQESGDQLI